MSHILRNVKKWAHNLWSTWWGKLIVICTIIISLISVFFISFFVSSVVDATHTANAFEQSENKQLKKKVTPDELASKPIKNGDYKFGDENSGIPDANQLKKFQNSSGTLTQLGFAGAPVSSGLKQPITSSPIYIGTSDKVLSLGTGTVTQNYNMGRGNNLLARHNFGGTSLSGNYKLGFSPLQKIDVSKKPVFYQTNGKTIYTYRLSKKHKIDVVNNPSKYVKVALSGSDKNKVTLITCDEPRYGFINLNPNKRIIVTGDLVNKQSFDSAPKAVKSVFPQLAS